MVRASIFHWFPVSPTYSHLGTVSSSHGLQVHGKSLSTYSYISGIRIFSAMGYGLRVVLTILSDFSRAQLLELWYGVLKLFCSCCSQGIIWSSHADLSGLGRHKLIVVFNTLSTPPVGSSTSVTQHINNQSPRLASRASLTVFKSQLRWFPLFSLFQFCPAGIVS